MNLTCSLNNWKSKLLFFMILNNTCMIFFRHALFDEWFASLLFYFYDFVPLCLFLSANSACHPDEIKSMGQCKKGVTPLRTHWSYVFLALTHRIVQISRVHTLWNVVWHYENATIRNEACLPAKSLVAITGTKILVPCHVVKSLATHLKFGHP